MEDASGEGEEECWIGEKGCHALKGYHALNNNNNNKLKFIPRSFYKNIQLRLTINIKLKIK